MKKYIVFSVVSIILLVGYSAWQFSLYHDSKLHVFFCDVGQGDSILIQTPSGKTILVDGGPTDAVLSCLSAHLPFWKRSIDLMILSHPHLDHFAGFMSVLQRYEVGQFVAEDVSNNTQGYQELLDSLAQKNIPVARVLASDKFVLPDGLQLNVIGPTASFIKNTSPTGLVGETKEFASIILDLAYKQTHIVLTGDSQERELLSALSLISSTNIVLQAPHHGSATGLTKNVLEKKHVLAAAISVGAKNRYGHPALSTLIALSKAHIPMYRTDLNGTIEFISNGTTIEVNREKSN
jgi:competence protein ComEC